jgi:Sec-independent protein translocase protein TatA
MIGPLEIAIIAVIVLVVLGYRYSDRLPGLGRRAGEGAREVTDTVRDAVGDKADPKLLGEKAGQGLREAREFRDALTGETEAAPKRKTDREPDEEDAPSAAERRSGDT